MLGSSSGVMRASVSPNKSFFTSHFLQWTCQGETINSSNCVSLCSVWTVKERGVRGLHTPLRGNVPSSAPGIRKHRLLFSWSGVLLANHGRLWSTVSSDKDKQPLCIGLFVFVCEHACMEVSCRRPREAAVILTEEWSYRWADVFKGGSAIKDHTMSVNVRWLAAE